jgi:hypothetical protein
VSADNWTTCPKCVDEVTRAALAEQQRVQSLYGEVDVEEFDRQRAALKPPDLVACETFREDYEFYGAENGTVHVSYSGRCTRCGAGLDFKDEKTFWSPAPAPSEEER